MLCSPINIFHDQVNTRMDIEEIKLRLVRPATKFAAGGFRPTHEHDESWLGKVFLFRPDETIPLNAAGEQMLPYAQFHLPSLPYTCPALADVRVLTLFISREFPEPFEPMGENWLIREYGEAFSGGLASQGFSPEGRVDGRLSVMGWRWRSRSA